MKKLCFLFISLVLSLLSSSCVAAPAHPDLIYLYTDANGVRIPFRFGVDTTRAYNLAFPATVTTPQRNQILALSQFNNYGYSGVNPTVTTENLFPPGSVPATMIANDVPETTSWAVTAANIGTVFQVTTGASTLTATLPSAAAVGDGFYFFVNKLDVDGPFITSGKVIFSGGLATAAVAMQNSFALVWTDGVTWYIRWQNDTVDASGNETNSALGSISLQPNNTYQNSGTAKPILYLGPPTSIQPLGSSETTGGYIITATGGSGINQPASNLIIQPGAPTGNYNLSGQITLNTFTPGGSGSTPQSVQSVLVADGFLTTLYSLGGPMHFFVQGGAGNNYQFVNSLTPGGGYLTGSKTGGGLDITGSTSGGTPDAGNVGEFLTANIASPGVNLTTATAKDVITLSLTAGNWRVWGTVFFTGGAVTGTIANASISQTLNTAGPFTASGITPTMATATSDVSVTIAPFQVLNTGPGSVTEHLVATLTFSGGTGKAYGVIFAERIY